MPVVCYFTDGKPGHENQTLGLLHALSARMDIQVCKLQPLSLMQALKVLLGGRYPQADALPEPWLVLGAGHATHLSVLAASRATGARSVVLMKPSLPMSWFDLCIVPEHDQVAARTNVLTTRGVLNRITPAAGREPGNGLILIGGPSRHYDWDNDAVIRQITNICSAPEQRWTVAGSRRTPADLSVRLDQLDHINWVAAEHTDAGWLPVQMGRAETIWISEDSVSMIYEALTAGARCGLIEVDRKQHNRITRGVDSLIEDNMLVSYSQWQQGQALHQPAQQLHESARCAEWIVQQWR